MIAWWLVACDVVGGGGGGGGGGRVDTRGDPVDPAQWWDCACSADLTTYYYYYYDVPIDDWDFCGTERGADNEVNQVSEDCFEAVYAAYGYSPECTCVCDPTGEEC